MVDPEYSKNIIMTLSRLPDFLCKSMLNQRLAEFDAMTREEQDEIIDGVILNASAIPFPDLSRLLGTWLQSVCKMTPDARRNLFSSYIDGICRNPGAFVTLNLDGMLEVLLSLDSDQRALITQSAREAMQNSQRTDILASVVPDNAKPHVGF